MADKLGDFAKNLGKGGTPVPGGIGKGVVALGALAGLAYAGANSFYNGKHFALHHKWM